MPLMENGKAADTGPRGTQGLGRGQGSRAIARRLLRRPPESLCPPRPDWSATVSAPTVMAAIAMSTQAPQRVSRSRPMMHESRMASRFLPIILVSCPVTVVRRTLVNVHPQESAPVVPGKTPGRTREMVDPVSTKALLGRQPERTDRGEG
ncbi:unnamed protein product [Gadus morhua 'NCC']